jgi:hypothetical protein
MMIDRHVMIVPEPTTNRKKFRREIALPHLLAAVRTRMM